MSTAEQLNSLKKEPIGYKVDDEYATKKDLKIALLEFAKEYKLEWMNIKLNLLIWGLGLLFTGCGTCFGFILKILLEIQSKI